jgi:hypothetical protein
MGRKWLFYQMANGDWIYFGGRSFSYSPIGHKHEILFSAEFSPMAGAWQKIRVPVTNDVDRNAEDKKKRLIF